MMHNRTRSINILLLFISVGVCLFVQSCNSPTSVQNHNYDMFPLRSGLQYKYSYSHIFADETHNNIIWIDSGFVDYVIRDSKIISPTLRVWIIDEKVNLLHRHYVYNYQLGGMTLDSSYLVNYYAIDSLKENLNDSHILSCQSIIWQFPLGVISTQLEPFARYSSSTDPALSYNYTWSSPMGITVEHFQEVKIKKYVFEKDKGLISFTFDDNLGSMAVSHSLITRVTLVGYSQTYPWQGLN